MAEGFLEPRTTLDSWDIRPGEAIADFGCGAGFFSVVLGQRAGPKGTVYAIDVRQEALDVTRAKAKIFQLSNIHFVRADLESPRGSGIANQGVDKVLITNVLFQEEDKDAILQEAHRILKDDGSLLVIEWDPETPVAKPKLPTIISKKEAERAITQIGFRLQKECSAGSHHYGLVFTK